MYIGIASAERVHMGSIDNFASKLMFEASLRGFNKRGPICRQNACNMDFEKIQHFPCVMDFDNGKLLHSCD